jgi:hypothetical protein
MIAGAARLGVRRLDAALLLPSDLLEGGQSSRSPPPLPRPSLPTVVGRRRLDAALLLPSDLLDGEQRGRPPPPLPRPSLPTVAGRRRLDAALLLPSDLLDGEQRSRFRPPLPRPSLPTVVGRRRLDAALLLPSDLLDGEQRGRPPPPLPRPPCRPWLEGGVKPPHSKALRAFSRTVMTRTCASCRKWLQPTSWRAGCDILWSRKLDKGPLSVGVSRVAVLAQANPWGGLRSRGLRQPTRKASPSVKKWATMLQARSRRQR